MSYRSIIKEFDNAIVTENQKLRDIYAKLLKESGCCGDDCSKEKETDDVETTAESCGDDIAGDIKEDEKNMVKNKPHNLQVSAKAFFEADEDGADEAPVEDPAPEEPTSEEPVGDELASEDDGAMVTAAEFFGDKGADDASAEEPTPAEEPKPEQDSSDEPAPTDESDKEMAPSTSFGEAEGGEDPVEDPAEQTPTEEPAPENTDDQKDVATEEEDHKKMMEFFAEGNPDDEPKSDGVEVEPEDGTDDDVVTEGDDPDAEEDEEARELRESIEAIKLFTKASKRFNG